MTNTKFEVDVLEILEHWETGELLALISALNIQGIISDEDDTGLSSTMVESWKDDCEAFLRKKGYSGGKIERCSKFFDKHGAIYALYDENSYSYEEALKHLAAINERPLFS